MTERRVPETQGDAAGHPPFRHVLDSLGRSTGWVLLEAPLVTAAHDERFAALRRTGHRFIGMSSYLTFPRGFDDHPLDYEAACEGWCHCVREPDRFLRTAMPRTLLSMSDFTDPRHVAPDRSHGGGGFDFVYVGPDSAWKREAKNLRLAALCVSRLGYDLGLRGLVVGLPMPDLVEADGMTFRSRLPWKDLLAEVAAARFLLVPNLCDPSPRIVAEALCLDVPVVVNQGILGGWKYVNRFTGAFFHGVDDVTASAADVQGGRCSPRAWFRANHGPYLAGRRLLSFVRSIDHSLEERSHLRLSAGGALAPAVMSRSRPAEAGPPSVSNGSTVRPRRSAPSGSADPRA